MKKSYLLIESNDSRFYVNLINWLNAYKVEPGSTKITVGDYDPFKLIHNLVEELTDKIQQSSENGDRRSGEIDFAIRTLKIIEDNSATKFIA